MVVAVHGNGRQTGSYGLQTALVGGYLEVSGPVSFQSGVGVLSGWVCTAEDVVIEITQADGTVVTQAAAYGTERLDTRTTPDGEELCGGHGQDGFGLLFNWNRRGWASEVRALWMGASS